MDIARRHRIADTKQLEAAVGIVGDGLRPTFDQRFVVDLAEVGRQGFQREVDLVEWQRAVFDYQLIDHAFAEKIAVITAQPDPNRIALAACRERAPAKGEAHVARQ